MRILFLHHNFPGQFKDLIEVRSRLGDDVRFVCDTQYKLEPKIKVYSTVGHAPGDKSPDKLDMDSKAVSKRFLGILKKLSDVEWIPDIIYSHSGWGCGLYAKCVFPDSRFIVFAEWWHTSNVSDPLSSFPLKDEPDTLAQSASASLRNSFQALELLEASSIVTPTHWQKSQYPALIQQNMSVIHEGVDTDFFSPSSDQDMNPVAKLSDKKEIIVTYTSRGLEPVRCFPEFVKALPELISQNDAIRVLIAGSDKIHYYGSPPKGFGSYRLWALSYLSEKLSKSQLERVKFLGTLPIKKYRKLLRLSDIHFYYTRPFVASWSLLEAMSTGCLLIAGKTINTKELLGENGLYFDPASQSSLIDSFRSALWLDLEERNTLTRSARDRVCQNYCLHISRALYQCL